MNRIKGFTLIELLIVVAIIGILAAIAIPNFLQAQTRAKVSRVKADTRSIVTAIESYFIDYNAYAPIHRQDLLTTPIDYISSYPKSPFNEVPWWWGGSPPSPVPFPYDENNMPTYLYVTAKGGATQPPGTDEYTLRDDWIRYGSDVDRTTPITVDTNNSSVKWNLKSNGPNNDDDWNYFSGSNPVSLQYDPTNGTISIGDIVRFGPGRSFN